MGATNSFPKHNRIIVQLRMPPPTRTRQYFQSLCRFFSGKVSIFGLHHNWPALKPVEAKKQRAHSSRIHSRRPPTHRLLGSCCASRHQQRSSESKSSGSCQARSIPSANMGGKVDIITLEHFHNTQPEWSADRPNHLYAVVDMGSNGIRFSISDLSPPQTRLLKCVYRDRAAISLFDAIYQPSVEGQAPPPPVLPQKTIELVSETVGRFWSIAVNDYEVPRHQFAVVATEAMRKSENASDMIEAIQTQAPGITMHILDPLVETLFGAVGARSGFVDVKGLFLDLGGGSVQMTYMDSYAARTNPTSEDYPLVAAAAGRSLPFGAARLIKLLEDPNPEVQAAELPKLQTGMNEAFQKLCAQFPSLAAVADEVGAQEESWSKKTKEEKQMVGIDIYLCGGGFRGYGSMLMHNSVIQPYPFPAMGSYTVSGKEFRKTKDMLKVNESFDDKIYGMSKRRRAQFPAIVAVVDALVTAVPRIRSVTFCAGGNREGALMMKLPKQVREGDPLLHIETIQDSVATQAVLDALSSAIPQGADLRDTVLESDLGHVYAGHIWAGLGGDVDANASAALHDAITRHPGCPGLTHLGRAILGVTLCARWGSNVGPSDQTLFHGLRELLRLSSPDSVFWAEYIGAVTSVLAMAIVTWPKTAKSITDKIRFDCHVQEGENKDKIFLVVSVDRAIADFLRLEDPASHFKGIAKKRNDRKVRVEVSVKVMN